MSRTGKHVFLLSTLVCTTALIGFINMSRSAPQKKHRAAAPAPIP